MIFFYLTQIALEVSTSVSWYIVKNTAYGLYEGSRYLIYGPKKDPYQQLMLEFSELNKRLDTLETK